MKSANQFHFDFFLAGGNHPQGEDAREHFVSTFVEPPNFNQLVEDLTPAENFKKVVLVDGHPRSGKTWCVVKALEKIIGEKDLKESQWWTSGIDSLKVFPEDENDLYSAACMVQDELSPELHYVLLDDFFGTNQLRPIGKRIDDLRVRPFFLWNEENPWLQRMSKGSVLIITTRSLHVTLSDILLETDIRAGAPASTGITVKNSRRGIFRTIDKGEPFGSFNRETLKDACEKNRKHHPLLTRYGDLNWALDAVPLLAFESYESTSANEECERDGEAEKKLTEPQKRIASRALFGDDMDSLAEIIVNIESPEEDFERDWLRHTLEQLYETYLVLIAPGLLFLGHSAYESLGIEKALSEIAVDRLYLTRTEEEFYSGRLPNEFYMIAVEQHLKSHLSLAGRAFVSLLGDQMRHPSEVVVTDGANKDIGLSPPQTSLGIGLRGLIERALYSQDHRHFLTLFESSAFSNATNIYLKESRDCLLHLELDLAGLGKYGAAEACAIEITPGLAAATGWLLFKFFPPSARAVRETVEQWFPNRFRYLLNNYTTDEWRKVAVYSTFLQWVIRMEAKPEDGGLLSTIIDLAFKCPDDIRSKLEIVLFDELLWAKTEENRDLSDLTPLNKFVKIFEPEHPEEIDDHDHHWIVNILFSLAWHNGWMMFRETDLAIKADRWIDGIKLRALEWLSGRPELLDTTLQYHWSHFITQRAVWMRDWCFEGDPNKFELDYSKIARGSENENDNSLVLEIARAALHEDEMLNAHRVRNLLLLLGTRASRTKNIEELLVRIDQILDANAENQGVSESVLQAIFELGRQGFLEMWCESTTDNFRTWCQEKKDELFHHMVRAWEEYWRELYYHTHLDLLPRLQGGWVDVFPREWKSQGSRD